MIVEVEATIFVRNGQPVVTTWKVARTELERQVQFTVEDVQRMLPIKEKTFDEESDELCHVVRKSEMTPGVTRDQEHAVLEPVETGREEDTSDISNEVS